MKCGCYFLAFLLLLSSPGYSDVTLTDQEYNQVMTALIDSETRIERLETSLTILRETLSRQKQIFEQQEIYYQKLLKDRKLLRAKDTFMGILVGMLIGGIYFTYAGQ